MFNRRPIITLVALLGVLAAANASAQSPQSFVTDTLKGVALDPTTYTPTLLGYHAAMRDWSSSQLFFANGYREFNERFTRSGLPNDAPISYAEGRHLIRSDAWHHLKASLIFNVTTRIAEQILQKRYPKQRRMIRTVGWIDRVAVASFLSYRFAATHYRQASSNDQLTRQLGFK